VIIPYPILSGIGDGMGPLSEELVEKTWREVAGLSPVRAHNKMFEVI
jgi:hypothetical protein